MKSFIHSARSLITPTYEWIPTPSQPSSAPFNDDHASQFHGKLLIREEIPLDDPTFRSYLINQLFTAIPSIEKHLWGHRCRRCGTRAKRHFAPIPCARCDETHVYCRNCIEMGRVLACEPLYYWTGPSPNWSQQDHACHWDGNLTTYQQHASDQIVKSMTTPKAELLCWAVCGAGKTEMVFAGIAALLEQGKRVCLATPRADVVRELVPRFRTAFPHTSIQGLYGGSEQKDTPGQFVIATTHQLLRFAHAFDGMIIDEIDAFPFHHDPSLLFAANRAVKPTAARIYLTATPRKQHRKRVRAGKLATVFVPVRFHGHPLPVPILQLCWQLKKDLAKHQPPKAFFTWYKQRSHPDRQLLIFVPTIELAEKLTRTLQKYFASSGQTIKSVHAADHDRAEKVQQFRNKAYNVLVTTTILERGVTFPSVDVVILDAGHHVFDEAALVQIAGRAGRSPKDPTGEVVFFHDGKTEAIVKAVKSIEAMNKRGRRL
ncbi:DEAD/DEAH box helicase [Aquibacillus sediminis]|uniref:DEAD/DEAH box helicase n=1 Tax=Aquibacillus sediminis TaxID=2574734 RepID=UPI0011081CB6|nr:DEAD/DEAH box helicase family protein [Aquibacillus sediminis]